MPFNWNVETFPEFCRLLLEHENFTIIQQHTSADPAFDFVVTAAENIAQGSMLFEWNVECTTRSLTIEDVNRFMQPARQGRPVLVITTADLPASLRGYLKAAVSSLFPLVVWDLEVLYLKTSQRPMLRKLLSQFVTPKRLQPQIDGAKQLTVRLSECRPGRKDWKLYETVMVDILNFLWVPPLGLPHVQSRTVDRLEVRDALFPNRASDGFWLRMHHHWGANYVLCEFKNLTNGVGAEEVDQVRLYTQRKSIGRLAFVIGRHPARKAAMDAARIAYQYSDLMVLLLDDSHVIEMLQLKARGESSTQSLDALIDTALLAY